MGEGRHHHTKLNFYRYLLRFVQIFVVLVVLPRVASFLGLLGNTQGQLDIHDLIRWSFAIALGFGVVATSYFSQTAQVPEYEEEPNPGNRKEIRRREKEAAYFAAVNSVVPVARRALLVFALLDGTFNLGDALYGANANGLFDTNTHGQALVAIYVIVTIVFGIAPTTLSMVLTRVIAAVDKIPTELENGQPVRNVLTSEQIEYRLANTVRSNTEPNTEHRIPNTVRQNIERRTANGGQANRITEYLSEHYGRTGMVPSINTVVNALDDPKPSRSTVSTVTNLWKEQVGIGDAASDVRG